MALLRAMVLRAILDIKRPRSRDPDEIKRDEVETRIRRRIEADSALYDAWRVSGLPLNEFAKLKGVSPLEVRRAVDYLKRYLRRESKLVYPNATEWIFSPSRDPFSFTWVLEQLFEDPIGIRTLIRKHLRNVQNPLNGKRTHV